MVLYEAIGRILEPPEVRTEKLLAVAICGLFVNLFGIMSFRYVTGKTRFCFVESVNMDVICVGEKKKIFELEYLFQIHEDEILTVLSPVAIHIHMGMDTVIITDTVMVMGTAMDMAMGTVTDMVMDKKVAAAMDTVISLMPICRVSVLFSTVIYNMHYYHNPF